MRLSFSVFWYLYIVQWFVSVGLAELATRKYKPAAKNFLQASFDNCECPEVSEIRYIMRTYICCYAILVSRETRRDW